MPAAVAADRLTKTFRAWSSPWERLTGALAGAAPAGGIEALAAVSFDLGAGESLAVVGENGAGKSTLLRLLAGITAPSSGAARVRGRVAAILELGGGFEPELSGRRNVALGAALHGLSADETRRKTPAILEFAELGEFIDRPVKTYSDGMAMRLGFAIATEVEPDVLLVDETLAVGDGYFQKKCMDRLARFTARGGILVLCTHAMYYAAALCRRALWLRRGRVEAEGPALDVIRAYEAHLLGRAVPGADERRGAGEAGPGRWERVALAASGAGAAELAPGRPLSVELEWSADGGERAFHVGIGIDRTDGVQVASFGTLQDGRRPFSGRRRYRVALDLPRLPLRQGEFALFAYLLDERGLHVYDQRVVADAFRIAGEDYRMGLLELEHRWRELDG